MEKPPDGAGTQCYLQCIALPYPIPGLRGLYLSSQRNGFAIHSALFQRSLQHSTDDYSQESKEEGRQPPLFLGVCDSAAVQFH